jgi:hypothetical protein
MAPGARYSVATLDHVALSTTIPIMVLAAVVLLAVRDATAGDGWLRLAAVRLFRAPAIHAFFIPPGFLPGYKTTINQLWATVDQTTAQEQPHNQK